MLVLGRRCGYHTPSLLLYKKEEVCSCAYESTRHLSSIQCVCRCRYPYRIVPMSLLFGLLVRVRMLFCTGLDCWILRMRHTCSVIFCCSTRSSSSHRPHALCFLSVGSSSASTSTSHATPLHLCCFYWYASLIGGLHQLTQVTCNEYHSHVSNPVTTLALEHQRS